MDKLLLDKRKLVELAGHYSVSVGAVTAIADAQLKVDAETVHRGIDTIIAASEVVLRMTLHRFFEAEGFEREEHEQAN